MLTYAGPLTRRTHLTVVGCPVATVLLGMARATNHKPQHGSPLCRPEGFEPSTHGMAVQRTNHSAMRPTSITFWRLSSKEKLCST